MTRVKGFIDANVYEEAKRRMHHIYDIFDTVIVAFSGGKDSLVCVHLAREVALERGDDRPIKVAYRDEELIPDPVVKFMEEWRDVPWVDLRWYCLRNHSTKYILGQSISFTQWDPDREWLRPMPEWAITAEDLGMTSDFVFDQYSSDTVLAHGEPGKVAIVTGVRAAESIMRFNALKAKLHDNYINAVVDKRVMTCKPIFDWQENDVFRYFYDHDIRYCPIYDGQLWSGTPLRVSMPTHAESAKTFGKLREFAPEFYDQLIALMPEMAVQERYYRELDRKGLIARYGSSWDGIRAWIDDTLTDERHREKALRLLRSAEMQALVTPESFPTDHVLKQLMTGLDHKSAILPLTKIEQQRRAAR
ncbi:PAPS reductase-like domain protein [Mycobacterium phage MmasiCarm]|nr:PAPS reductase-like domain protein [Mycobacterium phage Rita1961]WGH20881.1 PAPS reductase-like domain protein [Mycobacterium phage MmasiCarm]